MFKSADVRKIVIIIRAISVVRDRVLVTSNLQGKIFRPGLPHFRFDVLRETCRLAVL